jgi:hypothetical protein
MSSVGREAPFKPCANRGARTTAVLRAIKNPRICLLNQLSNPGNNSPVKKQLYSKPVLMRYGSLADLTMAVGNTGNADGGTGGSMKTA